jgi:hypothetical protein
MRLKMGAMSSIDLSPPSPKLQKRQQRQSAKEEEGG